MSCNNCGHNSHCGLPLYETSKVDGTGEEYQYEIVFILRDGNFKRSTHFEEDLILINV